MEIYLWWAMFFVLMILTVFSMIRGLMNRIDQQSNSKIHVLEEKVKKLEEEIQSLS